MKQFLVLTRTSAASLEPVAVRILALLAEYGAQTTVITLPEEGAEKSRIPVPEGTDCILSLGGDGTLVQAATATYGAQIPLLGINLGHLGYLCELDRETALLQLPRLFAGDYLVEERMMLAGRLLRVDGTQSESEDALNDVVLCGERPMSMLRIAVSINREPLYVLNCDGMILATPSGSTAYNLSAGGPVVDPKTEAILLTPINPHSMNIRTLVLDPDDEITLSVLARHDGDTVRGQAAFDGRRTLFVPEKQALVVRKAQMKTRLIRLSEMNFLERMRSKMGET